MNRILDTHLLPCFVFLNLAGGLAGNITVSILLASDAADAAVNYIHLYTQAAIEVSTP